MKCTKSKKLATAVSGCWKGFAVVGGKSKNVCCTAATKAEEDDDDAEGNKIAASQQQLHDEGRGWAIRTRGDGEEEEDRQTGDGARRMWRRRKYERAYTEEGEARAEYRNGTQI